MESLGDILRRRETLRPIRSGQTDSVPAHNRPPSRGAPLSDEKVCPLCGGFGFVYPSLPTGHTDFGKGVPCECTQQELEERWLPRLQRYSNLGPLLRMTFDALVPHGRSGDPANQEQFRRALQAAKEYAQDPQGWLVFTGSSGAGKTHLAASITNELIRRRVPALFIVVPDLLDHLRATFGPQSNDTYDDLFDLVRNAPVLVLDDLGTQSATPWAQEKLFQLLNHRYSVQLPTVITLGSTLEALDPRIRHRITDPAIAQVWALEQHEDALFQYRGALALQKLSQMTFKSFDTTGLTATSDQQRSLRVAYETALRFAEHPEGWLVLMGHVGSGKTHLAAAIANYRLQQATPVIFVVVADLLDHLRSTFAPDSKLTYDVLFEGIKNTPLLILDDLGTQTSSPWAQEKLFQLLNHRYNGLLPTVITTSLTPGELTAISPAVASRIGDTLVSKHITIDAQDYRGAEPPRKGAERAETGSRRPRR